MLEDAPGQVPGLLFIANDIAPRAPGGADAAVANLHHPDAEEIGPGLHAVLAGAAAGGILGFEGDAEVEHGAGKENVGLVCSPSPASPAAGRRGFALRGAACGKAKDGYLYPRQGAHG
jgi:hypothetical protein